MKKIKRFTLVAIIMTLIAVCLFLTVYIIGVARAKNPEAVVESFSGVMQSALHIIVPAIIRRLPRR